MAEKIKIKQSELDDIYEIEDDSDPTETKQGETLKAYSERMDLEITEND